MPATTLYLVRHAEAEGQEDSDNPGLSPLGKRQAAAVGTRLKGVGATELQHSSTRRAIETAIGGRAANDSTTRSLSSAGSET